MSMILSLRTLRDENIDRLLAEPALVWRVVAPDVPELYYDAAGLGRKPGFIGRMFGAKERPLPEAPPTIEFVDGEGEEIDLDKAWHGIQFMLTGSAWDGDAPLNFLVLGGDPVGDIDVGYGPARVQKSGVVSEIKEALDTVGPDDLKARYDPAAMKNLDIYPDIWDEEDEEPLEYCLENFQELKAFVANAEKGGFGILLQLA